MVGKVTSVFRESRPEDDLMCLTSGHFCPRFGSGRPPADPYRRLRRPRSRRRRRGHTTRDVPPLQGSSRGRSESRGWRPWLFSTAPLGLDPAPKERQAIARGVSPGYWLRRMRALKGRHVKTKRRTAGRDEHGTRWVPPGSPLVLVVPCQANAFAA